MKDESEKSLHSNFFILHNSCFILLLLQLREVT